MGERMDIVMFKISRVGRHESERQNEDENEN
jgi:hypothetical protein